MKTKLPDKITTIQEAKVFLTELHNNNEMYHPEDSVHDIAWSKEVNVTKEEADKLDNLMESIYNLPGNDGRHVNLLFDPCEYLLRLNKQFIVKDLSGRDYRMKATGAHIIDYIVPDMDSEEEQEECKEWVDSAEEGDEWSTNNLKLIAI